MAFSSAASSKPRLLVRAGSFFFANRNWLLTVTMLALFFLLRPVYPGSSARLDGLLDLLGILVILAGQAIRVIVIGLAYIVRGGKGGKVYAEKLVTEGFFNHCRNPLYIGNIMIYLGLFMISNNPLAYLIGVPFVFLVYISIVAAEEEYLRRTFGGEYDDYCARVNRWLPYLRNLRQTVKGMEFSWLRVLLKEYNSTYTWVSGVLFLIAYERIVHQGYVGAHGLILVLAGAWILATVAYSVVRYLKLSHRLTAD